MQMRIKHTFKHYKHKTQYLQPSKVHLYAFNAPNLQTSNMEHSNALLNPPNTQNSLPNQLAIKSLVKTKFFGHSLAEEGNFLVHVISIP